MNVVNKQLQLERFLLKFSYHKGGMRKLGVDLTGAGKGRYFRETKERDTITLWRFQNAIMKHMLIQKYIHDVCAHAHIHIEIHTHTCNF